MDTRVGPGDLIVARVGSRRAKILVKRVTEINGRSYIEGAEVAEIGTARATKLNQLGVPGTTTLINGQLYEKLRSRTVRPDQVIG